MNEAEATIEILSEIIVKLRRERDQLRQLAQQLSDEAKATKEKTT